MIFKTLNAKLIAILALALVFFGLTSLGVTLLALRGHERETTQRLSRNLADQLVAGEVLMVDGQVDEEALERVFRTLTLVNPTIEVYLVDQDGKIVTHSAETALELDSIDLEPVMTLMDPSAPLPVLGDDPTDASARTIFSVSPIMVEDSYAGYIYVVLDSGTSIGTAEAFRGSLVLRLAAIVLGIGLLGALGLGVVLIRLLSGRLSRLAEAMDDFRSSGLSVPIVAPEEGEGGDEISRLGSTFNRMVERIFQQIQRLKRTDELRRELIADVSHDLKTPLSSLQGYLETMMIQRDELEDEERDEYVEIAFNQSERLGRMIEQLLELARLEAKDVEPEIEPFSLAELVGDLIQEFSLRADERGVELGCSLPEDLPLVAADIGLIQRVLANLLDNALQHTSEGGSVKVTLEARGDEVAVQIADTGCGIPHEDLAKVFDRHYQGTKTSTGGASGGLGLAIVKRILELHGSAIEAASRVGKGTTFSFSLRSPI